VGVGVDAGNVSVAVGRLVGVLEATGLCVVVLVEVGDG